ncbi:hypothetical protein D9M70_369460 [compost metagenome]
MLSQVEADGLFLFVDAQAHDHVQHLQDHEGHDAGVDHGEGHAFELDEQLGTDVFHGAETTQGRRCEYAGQQGADDTADAVYTEGVQGVVVAQLALQAGGAEVADHAGSQADDQGAHRADGAGSRGDGDQAGNHAGRDTQGARLTVGQPLGEHPAQGSGSGGDLGDQHGHAGSTVGGHGGTGVEAEPADPQHGGAHQGVAQVVRGHRGGRITLALAQHQAGDQASHTGVDVHHGAAGEVQHAPVPHQGAVAAPHHVGDRRIDQGEPDGHEHQHGGELHALGKGTHDQGGGDDGERHLEGDEYALGEGRDQAVDADAAEERLGEAADEGAEVEYALLHAGGIEGQAVAVDHPEDADQTGDGEALHHHRQNVLGPHHAAIEQRQAGDGHEQDQCGGGKHPRRVATVQHYLVGGHGQARGNEGQKGS